MIVQEVRAIRYRRFLTQAELSVRSEVSVRVIKRMESGESVALSSIRAVAEALGVEPQELVEEAGGIEQNPQPK